MTSSFFRKHGRSAALVAAGLVAGGVLAGAMSANAADDPSGSTPAPTSSSASVSDPNAGDPSKPQRNDETLLTGDTAQRVKDAVSAAYPGATFIRVETDSDGVYEAHITKADGTATSIEVGSDYAVTGEEVGGGGRGGHGRHGGGDGDGDHGRGGNDNDADDQGASGDAATATPSA